MKKSAIMIIISIIALIGIIFAVLFKSDFFKNKIKPSGNTANETEEVINNTEETEGEGAGAGNEGGESEEVVVLSAEQKIEADKRTKDADLYEEAILNNNSSQCGSIEEEYTKDLCYKNIAIELLDAVVCGFIKDPDSRETCKFVIIKEEANKSKSVEPCKKLEKKDLADRCIKQVAAGNFCSDEECLDKTVSPDADQDGLSDLLEEIYYKTNSKDPDTDKDGYKDGDEVKGGFNPKGAGKLIQ